MLDTSSRPVVCSGLAFHEHIQPTLTARASWSGPAWSRPTKFHDGSSAGDTFHLDLDGTVITDRYIEVDPSHRLVIGWDRQGTDTATPAPAFIEITFTPAGDGTNVEIQFSGLSEEDDAFYGQLWERYLDRIATAKGSRFPPPDPLRRGVLVLARMRG
jgi:uncharacterized protein YndB with AHSA1/START domain